MLRKICISFLVAAFALTLAPTLVAAAAPEIIGGHILPGADEVTKTTIATNATQWVQNTFLKNLIDQAIGWAAALSVIFLIIGGYQYLTAVGNEEQIKVAHKTLIWSLVGIFLAMFSFAIVQIVVNIQFEKAGADLLAARTIDVLPFVEESWNKVPEIKALPQAEFKEEFLPIVARFLIYAMAFIAAIVVSFSGASLVNGWGDEAVVKKSKNAIIWGLTGLAFAAASYIIVKSIFTVDFGSGNSSVSSSSSQSASGIDGLLSAGEDLLSAGEEFLLGGDGDGETTDSEPMIIANQPSIQCHINTIQDPTGSAANVVFVSDASECACADGYKEVGSDSRGVICDVDSGWFW